MQKKLLNKMNLEQIYKEEFSTETITFSEKNLLSIWNKLELGEHSFQYYSAKNIYYDVFCDIVEDNVNTDLKFLSSGWKISLSGALIKTAITTALLASAFYLLEADSIPLQLIPAIIPVLFDIERIKLSRGDKYLIGEIYAKKKLRNKFLGIEDLYKKLPNKVKKQLNKKDFYDFVEKLISVGIAKKNNKSEISIVDSTPNFKINIS